MASISFTDNRTVIPAAWANDVNTITYTYLLAGALTIPGSIAVNTNKFTVASATGNTSIAGTLNVTGAVSFGSASFTSLDNTPIGQVTPAAGSFTTLNATTGINSTNIGASIPGTGAFTTLTANNTVTLSPASHNVVLSPTGTGVVTINPATAGTLDNVTIGATTPKPITGTTGSFTSTLGSTGNFNVNTNKFTVDATTGNTGIAGTLSVTSSLSSASVVSTTITASGGSFIQSAPPDTNVYAMDGSAATKTIANGANITLTGGNNFGGMVIITNQTNGEIALFITGGGTTTLVSQSGSTFANTPTGGKTSLAWTGTILQLVNNVGSSQTYGTILLRTRTTN